MDGGELVEYGQVVDGFSIHDAMVVASHRAQQTEAILTTDGVIRDAGHDTIWN